MAHSLSFAQPLSLSLTLLLACFHHGMLRAKLKRRRPCRYSRPALSLSLSATMVMPQVEIPAVAMALVASLPWTILGLDAKPL